MTFPHTVRILRESAQVANAVETFAGYAVAFQSLNCNCEPLPGWRQSTMLGDIAGKRFIMSWGNEELREGDRVEWLGKVYVLRPDVDDRYRGPSLVSPYQTGTLSQETVPRG